ncbi:MULTISPECIES: HEAT repeat domain-containing protein [Chlamydia]|uniref:HEAT repeat domain-containing protein n=1 Tax=Chlamydia crocodili TaxID=2766982 RepID=A0ABX8CI02_9CHLA|nr:HEAT repeat domain-containing protein [Chlamydia crocodili]QVE48807.1 HEAT repeat domain-containing protein [Chlamydia crocodili]
MAEGSQSLRQHLLIHDFPEAIKEAKILLSSCECTLPEIRLALKAFAQGKDYATWSQEFNKCCQHYPQLAKDRDTLEDFAQQILCDGISHPSMTVRAVSILAIGLARDFRLVPLVLSSLSDDSVVVRTLALQVVLQYGTQSLKDAVYKIARHDESMQVRITAYQIAAMLDIEELLPYLQERANNKLIDGEERREAWKASLMLTPQLLTGSKVKEDMDQALFACELLRHEGDGKDEDVLLDLLSIQYPEIQETALRAALACGRRVSCESRKIADQVRHIAQTSPFPKVRLQAAAILYLQGDPLGEELLVKGLQSPFVSICEAASAAVCSLGIRGKDLANNYLHIVTSRKAAANLAILLLVSRTNIEKAGDVIADFICDPEMCWAIEQFLWDSQWNPKSAALPLYFDMVKREISRKLIRLLAVAKYSNVKKVTEDFLSNRQQQGWSFFSGVFWEEGDEQSAQVWTADKSFSSKLESTLAALCQKKNNESLYKAKGLYPKSRWQDKLAILEGIAFSENTEAVDFLLECCYHETPSLRSAAAGALFALFK